MTVQTPAQWLASQNSGTSIQPSLNKKRVQTPAEWLLTHPSGPAEETLGQKILGFGKDIAQDAIGTLLVKPAARATEAITRTVAPESMAAKGYELQADEGKGQDLSLGVLGKYNVPTVKAFGQGGGKQIAGDALQSAAWLGPEMIMGKLPALAVGASKLTPEAIKTAKFVSKMAGLGTVAASGVAFGAGGAMEAGLGGEDIAKQAVLGGALGLGGGLVFEGIGKALKGKTKVPTISEDVAPKITTELEQKIKPKITSKATQEVTENIHPSVETPEVQKSIKKIKEQAHFDSPDDLTFESTDFNERNKRILSQTTEHIDDVISGAQKPIQGTTYADYWRVASEVASKQNDTQKLLDLGLSKTKIIKSSQTGKELGAIAQIDKSNTASIISQITEEKLGKLPGRIIKNQSKDIKVIKSGLKDFFDNFKEKIPTVEDIKSAMSGLDKIICK